jgi:hypothetical protein
MFFLYCHIDYIHVLTSRSIEIYLLAYALIFVQENYTSYIKGWREYYTWIPTRGILDSSLVVNPVGSFPKKKQNMRCVVRVSMSSPTSCLIQKWKHHRQALIPPWIVRDTRWWWSPPPTLSLLTYPSCSLPAPLHGPPNQHQPTVAVVPKDEHASTHTPTSTLWLEAPWQTLEDTVGLNPLIVSSSPPI